MMGLRTYTIEAEMTRQSTVRAARAHLTKLIDAALAGEDIVVLRDGKPAVRFAAIPQSGFRIGLLNGKLGEGPDFFEQLGELELTR